MLEQMVTDEQVEAMGARRLDLGLMRPPLETSGSGVRIAHVPLLWERLLLAVPEDHVLASGREPSVTDLDGQPFLSWSPRGGTYFLNLLASLFREAGVTPRTVQRVNQTHTILALVGVGLGIALVPESARCLCPMGVVLRSIELPRSARAELLLAWREGDTNPALPKLRELALGLFSGQRGR